MLLLKGNLLFRLSMAEFSRAEHNAFLMGIICTRGIYDDELTTANKKPPKRRKVYCIEHFIIMTISSIYMCFIDKLCYDYY